MSRLTNRITAFAPATVANVAVGFDILGFSMDQVGDKVTVERTGKPTEIVVESITGVVTEIPKDPSKNTAAVALRAMVDALGLDHGFRIWIEKGIPMGSGMGGSAASAVGAVVAAAALLDRPANDPISALKLLEFAVIGEEAASGAKHADNVAPCLLGGLTLVLSALPARVVPIPAPEGVYCVLTHPHLKIETRYARSVLRPQLLLAEHVRQSAHLGALIAACFRSDIELIRSSLIDTLIEPQRAGLIPGFDEAKAAAMAQGALGFSISGSGPSVFAWTSSQNAAERVRAAVGRAFEAQGLAVDAWIAPLGQQGARVLK